MKFKFYKTLAIISIILGLAIISSLGVTTIGAVIGTDKLANNTTAIFGAFFTIVGAVLLLIEFKK
ncbi:MAG: hypothetical protein U9Q06_02670 [Nanoarchaeota archaeon]|nr:hypothetical protein [Nanoarchaeota archaeon]